MKKLLVYLIFFIPVAGTLAQAPLDKYLQIAAENNPGLQARHAAFEADMEKIPQVKSLEDPTLSFGYFIGPRVSLSQMFPWFGTLRAKGDVAALQAEASYFKFIDAREKLFLQIKNKYYELWEVQKLVELEEENLKVLTSFERLAETRFGSGEGRLAQVFKVQLEIKQGETKLSLLESRLRPLKKVLSRLINSSDSLDIVVQDSIPLVPPGPLVAADSLPVHPQVSISRLQRAAAKKSRYVAQKSGYPSFGLGVEYMMMGNGDDIGMSDNRKNLVMPMVTLGLPIWRKKYKAAIREAEFKEDQFAHEMEDTGNMLASELDMALYRLQVAEEEMKLYQSETEIAERTLELTISDYTSDLEDFEEILLVQQKLIRFERSYYDAYKKYLLAKANIDYLTFEVSEKDINH